MYSWPYTLGKIIKKNLLQLPKKLDANCFYSNNRIVTFSLSFFLNSTKRFDEDKFRKLFHLENAENPLTRIHHTYFLSTCHAVLGQGVGLNILTSGHLKKNVTKNLNNRIYRRPSCCRHPTSSYLEKEKTFPICYDTQSYVSFFWCGFNQHAHGVLERIAAYFRQYWFLDEKLSISSIPDMIKAKILNVYQGQFGFEAEAFLSSWLLPTRYYK